ncbi:FmdB family zinc ribbon protein [Salidesulfovibrio onnuriiensis]|uniref:FmdB family zinc ribbon protein n=1 Tax=Salidesulfovibrio onnuriiensis TaxID=2583823 RepID=UPI0011CA9584|nr:zinc ribbon domain-containing protein [Salidesulfovibrio onnuriiensis]
MPIFEYVCEKCGNEFEELVFDRNEHPPCPKCQSVQTSKLMSAVRSKVGSGAAGGESQGEAPSTPSTSSSSPCAGCSGGNCSTCGS